MKSGRQFKFGDVILTEVFFTDLIHKKRRPALVLFEKYSNVIVAGITSNPSMDGVLLRKRKGLPVDSVVKLNYIFTIDKKSVVKKLCEITDREKEEVCSALNLCLPC